MSLELQGSLLITVFLFLITMSIGIFVCWTNGGKFKDLFSRFMPLSLLASSMFGIVMFVDMSKEINNDTYDRISTLQENYPKSNVDVIPMMSDGYISQFEYHNLSSKYHRFLYPNHSKEKVFSNMLK